MTPPRTGLVQGRAWNTGSWLPPPSSSPPKTGNVFQDKRHLTYLHTAGPGINHETQAARAITACRPAPSVCAGEATAARWLRDNPPPPGLGGRGRVSFPWLLNWSGAASKGQTQACRRHRGRRQPGWAWGSGAGTGRVKLATTGEQPAGLGAGGLEGREPSRPRHQWIPKTAPRPTATKARACASSGCPPHTPRGPAQKLKGQGGSVTNGDDPSDNCREKVTRGTEHVGPTCQAEGGAPERPHQAAAHPRRRPSQHTPCRPGRHHKPLTEQVSAADAPGALRLQISPSALLPGAARDPVPAWAASAPHTHEQQTRPLVEARPNSCPPSHTQPPGKAISMPWLKSIAAT